jgi:hypothetical protein
MARASSEFRSSGAFRLISIAVPLFAVVPAACNSARFGGSSPAAVVARQQAKI